MAKWWLITTIRTGGEPESNKQGRQSVIVDRIGYDKEGHTVYTKLGNGTEKWTEKS